MSPTAHLALINFFIGDIQGGLGPFLGTWLAETGEWSPSQVGLVTTIVGLAALTLSGPAGAFVDRFGRPRLLIVGSCAAILGGTLLMLPARGFALVLLANFLAAAGGTLLLLAVTDLTLGIVGKERFPRQQGTNQAFNHAGIVVAASVIAVSTARFGPGVALWIFGAMAAAAIVATATLPAGVWSKRRASGWKEDAEDEPERSPIGDILKNRRLLIFALALTLFQLGSGGMLTLLAQKLVASAVSGTRWTATYVIVAQFTMIPVAYLAGSLADRSGRRRLLIVACAVIPVRALLCAFIDDPYWLILAEVLDGIGAGIIGVAVPVVVADLTWGTGRTQTALGALNSVQGVGGALSAGFGGAMQGLFGWSGAFLAMGVAGLGALVMVFWLNATVEENPRRGKRRERSGDAAAGG